MSTNNCVCIPCRICKNFISINEFQEHLLNVHDISFLEYIGAVKFKEKKWSKEQKRQESAKKIK